MVTLKDATAQKHREAEQHVFNQKLMNGDLTDEEYGRYLSSMAEVFDTLETIVEPLHPDMKRTSKVIDDINELDLESEPEPCDTVYQYCEYLHRQSETDVYAHYYLQYLAIVFGGQMIKKNVPGSGTMYDFENEQEIVGAIRSKQLEHEEEWISEVMMGYDYMIKIFDDLEKYES